MIHGRKVVVVMPAYNAEKTIRQTVAQIPVDVVDEIVVVDDHSADRTVDVCAELGLPCIRHERNLGYGGNQKTCYAEALRRGADIVVMLHPDHQYTPLLITAMASMVGQGLFDIVLGSRMLGTGARKGGMPLYKFLANRALTAVENVLVGYRLAEYHTGYRAFSRKVLEALPLKANSDDFVFDNQVLAQAIHQGFSIGEVTCPTRYFPEASSMGFGRSVLCGFQILAVAFEFRLNRLGWIRTSAFSGDPGLRLDAAGGGIEGRARLDEHPDRGLR